MTPQEVRAAVERIKGDTWPHDPSRLDDEQCHADEDALWESVLEYIAGADKGPYGALAREALKTREIKFARWCA